MIVLEDASQLPKDCDLVIVGAGPAGMAAASLAAAFGLKVVLLDENPEPGGQIYRNIASKTSARSVLLGQAYDDGTALYDDLRRSDITFLSGANVWMISADLELGISSKGGSRHLRALHVLLATGARERPFPIPGWTLPGVMTAGAAQTLLKSSGLVPDKRFALVGSGPLMWLLASQLIRAEAIPTAVFDTTANSIFRSSLAGFAVSPYLLKGLTLLAHVARHTRLIRNVTKLGLEGTQQIEALCYRQKSGPLKREAFDMVLLHQGIVPNIHLARAVGCRIIWDERQLCWKPVVDEWWNSSLAGVSIAGDGAGIGGAEIAASSGRLAVIDIAIRLGKLAPDRRGKVAAPHLSQIRRYKRGRHFLDAVHLPAPTFRQAPDGTIVCRCENVAADKIRHVMKNAGTTGLNQTKFFLRCGMGLCQGRMCETTTAEILAEEGQTRISDLGPYRIRFPVNPVELNELNCFAKDSKGEEQCHM